MNDWIKELAKAITCGNCGETTTIESEHYCGKCGRVLCEECGKKYGRCKDHPKTILGDYPKESE